MSITFNNSVFGPGLWATVTLNAGVATVVTVESTDLQVNGTVTNPGDLLATNTGQVAATFAGTTAQFVLQNPDNTFIMLSDTPLTPGQQVGLGDGNAFIDAPCFAAGTRIQTRRGEIAVENLVVGDEVSTLLSGPYQRVSWIGSRAVDCARSRQPREVWPIRVRAGAFDVGKPSRDLFLSPDHAVYVDGNLVPIRLLENGATIAQQQVGSVHYYHVELENHDVVLAEGLPSESYLDTGNRYMFRNGGATVRLHPDFSGATDQARREAESCAPLVCDAMHVEPVWRSLAQRAEALGFALPVIETTSDPALCIVAEGKRFAPVSHDGDRYTFVLPKLANEIRLVSRSAPPSLLRPWDDRRQLGVAVRRIEVSSGNGSVTIPSDDPRLSDGWWPSEQNDAAIWRWTDGNALLPIAGGPMTVEVVTGQMLRYPLEHHRGITQHPFGRPREWRALSAQSERAA